jgi:hypothetical protein
MRARVAMGVEMALLLVAAIFFALHFVHLRADFPNHSFWMDWAKYTDEGWYGDAAIRHYQLGHWNVAGDFNPAAALPVWPLVEAALFRVTGVSLVAARSLTVVVFGLCLVCSYGLIRRWPNVSQHRNLAPAVGVLLLAVSPFCFVFMRLAILEPLLILLMLTALWTASTAGAAPWSDTPWRESLHTRRNLRPAAWAVVLGLLLPAMVLTKTTAVFLFPAIFWMLWAASGYRLWQFLRVATISCGVCGVVWLAYFVLVVRPHYLVDYRYLFSANGYTGVTLSTLWPVLQDTVTDGSWMGMTLYVLALIAAVGSALVLCATRLRGAPLTMALLLWVVGYTAFLAYHDNLQPRYYLVIAVPLTLLVAIAFDAVLAGAIDSYSLGIASLRSGFGVGLLRTMAMVGGVAVAFAAIHGGWQLIGFVRHPEYTFLSAANRVHDEVQREYDESKAKDGAGHSRLVLSISGSDISLMTGLPSICDDFGTMTLPDRVATYKPGWFATWNDVEDDKMDALSPMYRLVRVAALPAFDDPERNLLILYRLDSVPLQGRSHGRGRRRYLGTPPRPRVKTESPPVAPPLKD